MPSLVCNLLGVVAIVVSDAAEYQTNAGPRDGVLNVHIVPHTHDDAGWLKTVDEYYSGQNTSIQRAAVRYILDSVVRMLDENPDRKFSYVEQAFFQRWWRQQNDHIRNITRRLVANGQLTMINGGWVMHCEGTPHYLDMIDQTSLGHKLLMGEFGVMPRIGWQLDPFGHSATQAALLSEEVGFTGLFFGRIDYQDLQRRVEHREAEFIWRASESLGKESQVFTGLTGSYGGNYGPPDGFNFDIGSSDEPIQDDPNLENMNVQSRVDDFVKVATWQANHTRGNNILMTMGSDFQYEAAANWYTNLDKLIHYVNKDGRINAFYSNPELYMEEKAKEHVSWPLKTDDFFPYADGPHQFWTGYFTSRPNLKRFVRDSSAFFQIAKQLVALALPHEEFSVLEPLAEAMALLQHHDAVAGTEKQHAAFDYAKRLAQGRALAKGPVSRSLAALTTPNRRFEACIQRNISLCPATQDASRTQKTLFFLVWNGLAQSRTELVELPVASRQVQVTDMHGSVLPSQVVPSLSSLTDYGKPAGGADKTLYFKATLPPLGFSVFQLQASRDEKPTSPARAVEADVVIENEYLKVTFCAASGLMCKIMEKDSGIVVNAQQEWLWYRASIGNVESNQASGAYIFRPNRTEARRILGKDKPKLELIRGALAEEVRSDFGGQVTQRVRLAKGDRHLELTYTVHSLPVDDHLGKELVMRITTDIATKGECYTDSNGREMIYRKRDHRASWPFTQTEPVAGNYYPVGTAISIRDEKAQLTLLTDRVQSGSGTVKDGLLEMMVHRRLLKDDGRGVGEPLNETEFVVPYLKGLRGGRHYGPELVVRGTHYLTLGPPQRAAALWRPLQDRVYMPATPFFADGPLSSAVAPALSDADKVTRKTAAEAFSALKAPLPPNVQVVSLEPLDGKSVLLRLAHQFGVGEDAQLSQPARVDLDALFSGRVVASVEELGLTGTVPRSEILKRRISWSIEGEPSAESTHEGPHVMTSGQNSPRTVDLGPLQIRTFRVSFEVDSDVATYV